MRPGGSSIDATERQFPRSPDEAILRSCDESGRGALQSHSWISDGFGQKCSYTYAVAPLESADKAYSLLNLFVNSKFVRGMYMSGPRQSCGVGIPISARSASYPNAQF